MIPSLMDLRLLRPGHGDLRGKLIKKLFALVEATEVPKELPTVGYIYSYLLY